MTGRIDRLDDRDGDLVVVDYKTGRQVPSETDARTSLAMALYAVAAGRMFRRRCATVELHHVPSGTVAAHEHTPESLDRKVAEAESIASDLRRADADFGSVGSELDPLPAAPVGRLPVVRLPGPLPRGPGDGAGEVRLGGARRERL